MPQTFSTTTSSVADHWSFYATLSPAGVNNPPTVATAAFASPNPVNATTTNLSVLGADSGGEASLTYSWSATGPGAVSFSPNSTNSAKNSVATFTTAGNYLLQAAITDAQGLIVTSSVNVTVNQTLASIAVNPGSATVVAGGTQQFTASTKDQFGVAMLGQPTLVWAVSGGGVISSSGFFTAGNTPGGPFTVTATGNSLQSTANVTVTNSSVVIGEPNILSIDDNQNSNLLLAQLTTLGQSATIQTLSFYVTAAAGKLRLGIYDASGPGGGPGAKKAETNEVTPVVGWNTASVITPISLSPGTYWLAYLPSSDSLHFRRAGAGSVKFYSYAYGPMPQTFSTTTSSVADHWSFYATLSPAGVNNPPTVATAAFASPNPVNATTTTVSVLGADSGGEASLTYSWSATGPGAVSFSPNSTNSAKNSLATFTAAGNYVLQAAITDAQGLTVISSVNVTVNQTLASIAVNPGSATVVAGGTQQFTASAKDQFGVAMLGQPTLVWTVSGGGVISSSGFFTAGNTPGGPFTVTATGNSLQSTANVTVTNSSGQATLAWDPITNPSVTGCKFYTGTASRVYGTPVDVGFVTTYTVKGLLSGHTYYFAVTAYNSSKQESGFSNEVTYTVP